MPLRDRSRQPSLVRENASSATEWGVDEKPALRGFTVEWAEPGDFILSRGNRLYRSAALTGPFEEFASFPVPAWKAAAGRFRLPQRLLRHLFYNVLKLPGDELFLTFGKQIGVYRDGEMKTLAGMDRPCRVLRAACALDAHGDVYFGEYVPNTERGPIHIYRYQAGADSVEIVYTFESSAIRHVHGIYRDPFDGSLWCLTGDADSESRILRSDDGFKTVETIGTGDETWRAVSLQFTGEGIYYGMDAEFRSNHIFRIDRVTGERDDLGEVDGPVYYSHSIGSDLFFAVTAELCPSQIGNSATIWHVDTNGNLSKVVSYAKDAFDRRFFMHGTIHFSRGPGIPGEMLFHAVGLKNADNRSFRLKPEAAHGLNAEPQNQLYLIDHQGERRAMAQPDMMAYIGRKPCGCAVTLTRVGPAGSTTRLADIIAQDIKNGLIVELMPLAKAEKIELKFDCDCESRSLAKSA